MEMEMENTQAGMMLASQSTAKELTPKMQQTIKKKQETTN